MAPLLGLALALSGCSEVGALRRQTLHVVLVPTSSLEWLANQDRVRQSFAPQLAAFHQLHPNADLQFSVKTEAELKPYLQKANSRGLGPDLLFVRAPTAMSLIEAGLVQPLPDSRAVLDSLSLVSERERRRVQVGKAITGMPIFQEVSLACYDRSRLPQPPTTLEQLLAVAASGLPIGLSVDSIGVWWTAGGLGAQEALTPVILGPTANATVDRPAQLQADQRALVTWLRWLRQAVLQSRVDVGSGPQDLVAGLEAGRLVWIPCFSVMLGRLDHTMGKRLGVAPLPSGPAGPASPFATLRVWSLGINSSPSQRQMALDLINLTLEPRVQRNLMLSTLMILPANRYVPIPVASSLRLQALAASLDQVAGSTLMSQPFSSTRVSEVAPIIESQISMTMLGVVSPEQAAREIIRLARVRSSGSR